jgi:hypothetical protein
MSRADDLFRALAAAQDAALADRRPLDEVARALNRPQRAARRLRLAPLVVLGALAAGGLVLSLRAPRLHFQMEGTEGAAGRPLTAQADSELPLQFSDGSSIIFQPGSRGSVQRLTGAGAEVALEEGTLEARVVHADRTRWTVAAGPFRVRVTGTRFTTSWSPTRRALRVTLQEGSVVVEGALLGAGVPLRAGQRLAVDVDGGRVRTEPLAEPAAPAVAVEEPPPPAPATAGRARPTRRDDVWRDLAGKGEYRAALAAAERSGISARMQALDARGLLTLGDVARYAGAPQTAERAFLALVARFPEDPLAADAVFSLGRLAFEGERPQEAALWFERYVERWRGGPLADQAAGRLVECWLRAGDEAKARLAARSYLARAPAGPHAPLARRLLAGESP